MSCILDIADAVAAHINAGTYSQPVNAARLYQPAFTLEELRDLRVSVVPRSSSIVPATRDSCAFDSVVDVGIQKKIESDAEIDGLLEVVETIVDRLRQQKLPALTEATWVALAHDPVVSAEALEKNRVFTSVLSVTYRVRR